MRTPRVRKARVECPHCGREVYARIEPPLYVWASQRDPWRVVIGVECRHCGGNLNIMAGDVRRAA